MKFYDRDKELKHIKNLIKSDFSELVYIYGRRRIGKTKLILESLKKTKFLYFFVADKTYTQLLEDFEEVLRLNNIEVPSFKNFRQFFGFLVKYLAPQWYVFVFDEFQNFYRIDKSVYSDFQYIWDLNYEQQKIKVFVLGSMFSLLKKIFEWYKSPLYGRATSKIWLKPFDRQTQAEILNDYNLLTPYNLTYIYSIFWGVPKYLQIMLQQLALQDGLSNDLLSFVLDIYFEENSFFLPEAREILALEFGKSYEIYFSILASIAVGKNRRNQIAQYVGISEDSIWFYLQNLIKTFQIVKKVHSIQPSWFWRFARYDISDLFFKFWFRYVFKYNFLIESRQWDRLKKFIAKDINTYLGSAFEDLMREVLLDLNTQNRLPFEIDRLGKFFTKNWQIEIDLVGVNDKQKKVLFLECKLNSKKISKSVIKNLKDKVQQSGKFFEWKKYFWICTLNQLSNKILKNLQADYILSLEEVL